jgi:hypothetical protein
MRTPVLLAAALAALITAAPAGAAEQKLRVLILPTSDLAVLESLAARGAVGLLVPDAGPRTSEARARAALVRGQVRNSLREGLPEGAVLIEIAGETGPPEDLLQPGIFVGLPRGGDQANDRRYPVAVVAPGYRGLLMSDSTRIPGLVSIADIADTALGTGDALRSESSADPVAELRELDLRIDDNGTARMPAAAVTAVLIAALAVLLPAAAVLGFAAALAANLALGIGGVSYAGLVVPLIALAVGMGSPFVARRLRSPLAVAWISAGVLAAYLIAMAVDGSWVALSPFGPTQNARFFGLSNLLETIFLVPAFVGAYLLGKRFGLLGFGAAALLTLITVAGSRFGADGGGAIVLLAGYAVLLVLLAGSGRRSVVLAAAGAGALAVLVALDAALGPSTHVGETVRGGPDEVLSDLWERVELSWERATAGWLIGLAVLGAVVALVLLVARLPRLRVDRDGRALLLAYAAAIGVSLLVNDSPKEVSLGGLVGYFTLERWLLARPVRGGPPVELGANPFPRS